MERGAICDLLLSGASVGVVYVFFQIGVGLNLGTLPWIACSLGWRILAGAIVLVAAMVMSFGYALPIRFLQCHGEFRPRSSVFEIESSGGAKTARLQAIKTTVTNEMVEPQWFLIAACVALGVLSLIRSGFARDWRTWDSHLLDDEVCYVRAISIKFDEQAAYRYSTCFGRNGSYACRGRDRVICLLSPLQLICWTRLMICRWN